ncbi:MAG TPA: TonB-dependent receptor [Verrucomicrobiae bacterium]|nr:TonB-dependent receptor [Verrucomicrobiae bacterium]
MNDETLNTNQKALQLNMDAKVYGTFAEIGAGQEVARWFFHVGGAAGTVAKSISAYDMGVSDAIYGPSERYVSRKRLESMLAYEYKLLLERLDAKRGDKCTFFVFADTVATHSFTRHDEGQGWLGIRFQAEMKSEPSEIIIHARLLDPENVREQEALGMLGVNLIYAAFHYNKQPEVLIKSLMDGLTRNRIELDMIRFSGPAFAKLDNRLMSLQLVQQGLTDAAMFTADGEVVQPMDILYKKPVLVERGSFRPVTNTTLDMLDRAYEQFVEESNVKGDQPTVLMEMTLRNLLSDGGVDHKDFLQRVDVLSALGKTVLISNYARYYKLVAYLARYTQKPMGLALGVPSLREIFDEKFYTDLEGGLLESLGRLFKNSVKLYVYPWRDPVTGKVTTAESMKVAPHLQNLYAYLIENHYVESIQKHNVDYLPIFSRDVLARIQTYDPSWESMVPPQIVEIIKRDKLFGFREMRS